VAHGVGRGGRSSICRQIAESFFQELEHDMAFSVAHKDMIGAAVQVEAEAAKAFELAASSSETLAKGWCVAEYSKL